MDKSERAKKYPEYYFKDGRPKKKYMLCKDPAYIREVKACNGGSYRPEWVCGGLRCPLYSIGCKD